MFFAATTLLAGRQGKTEFSQATRDIESQIRSVVNDVSVSNFPFNKDHSCSIVDDKPRLKVAPSGLGTNTECIFLGKTLQIVNDDDASTTDSFNIYTVLGRRAEPDGKVVTDFTKANPSPIMGQSENEEIDLTQNYILPFGVSVKSANMTATDSSLSPTDLVGFYNSLQVTGSEQGSQSQLTLGYINFETIYEDPPYQNVSETIEGRSIFTAQPTKAWAICLASGTSSETALITVSASFSGITTKLDYVNCS
jgi:hypothetical protein